MNAKAFVLLAFALSPAVLAAQGTRSATDSTPHPAVDTSLRKMANAVRRDGEIRLDGRKFGKPASYHAMSAKVWGVTLPIALLTVLLSGRDDFLVLALIAGFISHLDCFIITCILPEWRHDVATAYDALAIRRVAGGSTSAT